MAHRTRNSAKAIIVEDGRLLVTRMRDEDGDFFLLPGGGQEPGETLEEALRRECREEIGLEPEIGALRFVRDYIGANHEFAATQSHFHQIESGLPIACRRTSWPQRPDPVLLQYRISAG